MNTPTDNFSNWARFPRLQTLQLSDWTVPEKQRVWLDWRNCFDLTRLPQPDQQQARANLANVTNLTVLDLCDNLPAALATMLHHMPHVTRLELPWTAMEEVDRGECAATLAVVSTMLSPHLEGLKLHWNLDERTATFLTERLPNLKALKFDRVGAADSWSADAGEGVWAALPCATLTSLRIGGGDGYLRLPFDQSSLRSPWLQMRELGRVQLPFDLVEEFAAGLPNLQLLVAAPTGDWGFTPAVFKRLERVRLDLCLEGFAGARLAQMFPAAVHVVTMVDGEMLRGPPPFINVAGMLSLTHLGLDYLDCQPSDHRTLAAISELPRLQQLSIDVPFQHLQQLFVLSRLSMLQALSVTVDEIEEGTDFATVLSAFSSLTALRSLRVAA